MSASTSLLASVCLILGMVCGCNHVGGNHVVGSGVAASEEREVGDFTGVRIEGSSNVIVTVGESPTLTIEADDNILPLIETVVRSGTLVIGSKDSYSSKLGIRVTLTTRALRSVEIAGSGSVSATGVDGGDFRARIAGSGDVEVKGTVDALTASINGSGDLRLGELEAVTAKVLIAGSGNATVSVRDELTVEIAGSGDVQYRGAPTRLDQTLAGSGRVRRID